jgi:hypothetical protein
MLRRIAVTVCFLAGCTPALGQVPTATRSTTPAPVPNGATATVQVPIDLAGTGNLSQSVDPGTIQITLDSRLPQARYDVTVRRELIPIAAIPLTGIGTIGSLQRLLPERSSDPCDPLVAAARALNDSATESQVSARRAVVNTLLEQGVCTNAVTVADARTVLAATSQSLQPILIREGERVTVTITRSVAQGEARTWVLVFETEPRGEWLTTFGVSFVPDHDERFTTEAIGNDKFKITEGEHVAALKPIGSVFFGWLSSGQQRRNWGWSPTVGFGVGADTLMVFGGLSAIFNRNLTFVGGIAITGQQRLQGRYRADQEVATTLTEDQLHRTVYRPTALFGVALRFDRNPFEKDPPTPPQTTPAASTSAPNTAAGASTATPATPSDVTRAPQQPIVEASRESDIKLRFDAQGALREPGVVKSLLERATTATDVFIISHGWWNDESSADCFYRRVVGGLEQQAPDYLTVERFKPLFVTLYWPSALFPTEPSDCADRRQESSVISAFAVDGVRKWASTAFPDAAGRTEFDVEVARVTTLLESERTSALSDAEAEELATIMVRWRDASGAGVAASEGGEPDLFAGSGPQIAQRWRERPNLRSELSLPNARRWLNFGNAFTFWTMKARAGVVGSRGMHDVLKALQPLRQRNVRIHLIGHSFGGKLLTASLSGSGGVTNRADSLVILQGAFSHFAFASRDEIVGAGVAIDRGGIYRDVLASSLVAGPIVVTYSSADLPNRVLYPAGVALVNDVTEAARAPRYGSLGANGFRGSPALALNLTTDTLASVESQSPRAVSVDASGVILGHSDLVKPQVFKLIWDAIERVR